MVYTAYYDASSKEEIVDVPLVLDGIAASEAKWVQFEAVWSRVLDEKDVEFLDIAKCAQWKGHPYDTWNRDESIRIPFLQRLAEILTVTATQAVVVRILPADFNAVNARYSLGNEYWQGAYSTATIKCVGIMENLLYPRPDVDHIAHIVEQGDTGQGAIVNLKSKGWPVTVLT
jgi:hypothetical protein